MTVASVLGKINHQEQFIVEQDDKMPASSPGHGSNTGPWSPPASQGWIFLIYSPGWRWWIFVVQLHKVFCWGRDMLCVAGKGQTDPKQLLLNHWFSWRLLAAAGDILGTDMGADPHLCVCLMIAGSSGKDPPFEPGVCFSCTDLQPSSPCQFPWSCL